MSNDTTPTHASSTNTNTQSGTTAPPTEIRWETYGTLTALACGVVATSVLGYMTGTILLTVLFMAELLHIVTLFVARRSRRW